LHKFKKALAFFIQMMIIFMISTSFVFAGTINGYGHLIKSNLNSKTIKLSDLQIKSDLRVVKEIEEEEEEAAPVCYKEGEKPLQGDEHKCCTGLQYYNNICTTPPNTPRKKCKEGDHNSCGTGQACLKSEVEDLYGDDASQDDAVDKIYQERESYTGVGKLLMLGPDSKMPCFNDKMCTTFNCVESEGKSGLGKLVRKAVKIKKCRDLYVCRCAAVNETLTGKAKCCPGLRTAPGGTKCMDPASLDALYADYTGLKPGFDPISCSINPDPASLLKYIKDTYIMRAWEWVTSTADQTDDCLGFAKRLRNDFGIPFRQKRVSIVNAFKASFEGIKGERNNLVNAKFSLNKTREEGGHTDEEANRMIAAERITGVDMIKLMIKEQELMIKYEQSLFALYTDFAQKLSVYATEWSAYGEKWNKKGERCRGLKIWPFKKSKNKRRWKRRYKVKHKGSGSGKGANAKLVNENSVKEMITALGGSTEGLKKRYFLIDPLMPGNFAKSSNKEFKRNGQSFLRAGKYRRTLGEPGFWSFALVFLIAGPLITIAAVVHNYKNRAEKGEKRLMVGIRKNMTPDLMDYFKRPQLNGDLELGLDATCLRTDFKQATGTYKSDQSYKNDKDYFSKDKKEKEEEEEDQLATEEYNQTMDEFTDDGSVKAEARIVGERVDSKTPRKCLKTALAISELASTAFSQWWLYSYSPKRTQEVMTTRIMLYGALATTFVDLNNYLNLLSGDHIGLRFQSIACLKRRLEEYGFSAENGLVAGQDKYESEIEDIEWQKSQQSMLDCKNCNLKGNGGAVGVKAPRSTTSSTLGNTNTHNSLGAPLVSRDIVDLNIAGKKWNSILQMRKKHNEKVMRDDPNAVERAKKIHGFFNRFSGPSNAGVAAASGFDLSQINLDQNGNPQRDPSSLSDAEKARLAQEAKDKLALDSGKYKKGPAGTGLSKSGKGKGSKEAKKGKTKKKNLKGLFDDDDESIFGDSDSDNDSDSKGSKTVKTYSGLSVQEDDEMVKSVTKGNAIKNMSGHTLWQKVTRAYFRSGIPRLLTRKVKRKPASTEKNRDHLPPEKRKFLEALEKLQTK
jgi:hypothetical protein